MGNFRAEATTAITPERLWESVTDPSFFLWEQYGITFSPNAPLTESSELHRSTQKSGGMGNMVLKVTDYAEAELLAVQLVSADHALAPQSASARLDIQPGSSPDATSLSVELNIEYSARRVVMGSKACEKLVYRRLKPRLELAVAELEARLMISD